METEKIIKRHIKRLEDIFNEIKQEIGTDSIEDYLDILVGLRSRLRVEFEDSLKELEKEEAV